MRSVFFVLWKLWCCFHISCRGGEEIVFLVVGQKLYTESGMYFELEYIEIGFCGILQKTNITLQNDEKLQDNSDGNFMK